MEDGARWFYESAAEQCRDSYAEWAFKEIADDEVSHRHTLEELYRTIFAAPPAEGFPYNCLEDWDAGL